MSWPSSPSIIASLLLLFAGWGRLQPAADFSPPLTVQIERLTGTEWKAADSAAVFSPGDSLRFRVRPAHSGFLYVINEGTSGSRSLLFPTEQTGLDHRVEAGREYLVPAKEGRFRVTGPPGRDRILWVLSPDRAPAGRLSPRCDDAIFRARGECLDTGPRAQVRVFELPLAHR